MSDNRQQGEQVRREVMGDAFVDRALNNATDFTQPLQDFVNEHAWGGVWTRGVLERKTRSLITLAALTALKCPQSSMTVKLGDVPVIASASARIAGLGLNGSLSPHSTAAGAVTSGS